VKLFLLKQTKKWWGKLLDMVKQKKLACKLVRQRRKSNCPALLKLPNRCFQNVKIAKKNTARKLVKY